MTKPLFAVINWAEGTIGSEIDQATGKAISYADFEKLCEETPVSGHCEKMSATILFNDGTQYQARIDRTNADRHGFTQHAQCFLASWPDLKTREMPASIKEAEQARFDFLSAVDFPA
jgi:hypothetical protein